MVIVNLRIRIRFLCKGRKLVQSAEEKIFMSSLPVNLKFETGMIGYGHSELQKKVLPYFSKNSLL